MTRISTHILDTSRGRPASDVEVSLDHAVAGGGWQRLGEARTDANGRIGEFPGAGPIAPGMHRLRFEVAAYFASAGVRPFFPVVEIIFEVREPSEHHHVPLLLNPFGYSTYRGS